MQQLVRSRTEAAAAAVNEGEVRDHRFRVPGCVDAVPVHMAPVLVQVDPVLLNVDPVPVQVDPVLVNVDPIPVQVDPVLVNRDAVHVEGERTPGISEESSIRDVFFRRAVDS